MRHLGGSAGGNVEGRREKAEGRSVKGKAEGGRRTGFEIGNWRFEKGIDWFSCEWERPAFSKRGYSGNGAGAPLGLFVPLVDGFEVFERGALAGIGIGGGFFGGNQGGQIEDGEGFATNAHRLAV